ncbi:MAG: CDP-alcohol phosphatidyltransferase family protein [Trueperella sp.]|nr:CDP-alcohol phosphatidyltransferase family protein [Trueperella sp.]
MLSRSGRPLAAVIFGPFAKAAVKLGITANQMTIIGAVAACISALVFFPLNMLWTGIIVTAVLVIFDNLDGQIARMTHTESEWGKFLDSTCDRITDGVVFAALGIWALRFADDSARLWIITGALATIVFGGVVPYARAKAESLGVNAAVGIAERADRLVAGLITMILVAAGLPHWVMAVGLWIIAVASFVTVLQRMVVVGKALTDRANAAQNRPTRPAGAPAQPRPRKTPPSTES